MVELKAVRAWSPNPEIVDPSNVVCPVYDTLSESDFSLYGARPYNAARFVPRPKSLEVRAFLDRASAALSEALRAHAYVQADRAAFYVYGIRYVPPPDILETLAVEDRRPEYLLLGLVGTLDFDGLEHGQIALHEKTFPDRVAERVALTDVTGMSFAPIMLGYQSPDHRLNNRLEKYLGLDRSRLSFESSTPPLVRTSIGETTHTLWKVEDPAEVAAVAEEVRPLRLLVLDGHHRFTAAAKRHYEGRPSAPLVMLVDGNDRALRLLPWHRVLSSAVAPFALLRSGARHEFMELLDLGAPPSPARAIERLHRMRRDGVRGFLMASTEGFVEVRGPRSDDAGVDFDLLHTFLDEGMQIDPQVLEFVRSPRQALDRAYRSDGSFPGGTAFLLPALSARGVEERAFDRGAVMAQKSTMFLPKVAEGMLFARADGTE